MAFGMDFFRRYQGRFLLVLTIVLMVTWFVGYQVAQFLAPKNSMGTVFGKAVTQDEYQTASAVIKTLTGAEPKSDAVWNFIVLRHEADRLGVKVSDEEIKRGTRSWVKSAFKLQSDDNIDQYYQVMLNVSGASPKSVEYAMRESLRNAKVMDMARTAYQVSDVKFWQTWNNMNLKVDLKTVSVTPPAKESMPMPTDEQLAEYFQKTVSAEETRHKYDLSAKATVEYVAALKSDFEKRFPVTDVEVSDYYEQNKASYIASTESDVNAASTDSAVEAASTESAAASTESQAAAPAAPAASTASETASTDSDVAQEVKYRPLSEVAAEIKDNLRAQKAREALSDLRYDLDNDKNATLKDQAALYSLSYDSVGPIKMTERAALGKLGTASAGEGDNKQGVVDVIFKEHPMDTQSAESEEGYFLFRVTAFEDARPSKIEEVKDQVINDYRKDAADKIATDEAAKVLAQVREKNSWEGLDPKYPVASITVPETAGSGYTMTSHPKLLEAVREMEVNEFGGPVLDSNAAVIFQVTARQDTDPSMFTRGMKPYMTSILFKKEMDKFNEDWQADLVKRADVRKNNVFDQESPAETSSMPSEEAPAGL